MALVKVQEYLDGSLMYFADNLEIEKPQLVTRPREVKGGRIVVAISSRGSKRYIFTEEDLVNVKDMEVIETPEWLENLW